MEETFRIFHERSGATMVYVTHDQSEAMALATDVAVMSEGRLVQVAPPAEIYARPEGSVVGGLIGRGSILRLPLPEGAPRALEWPMLRQAIGSTEAQAAFVATCWCGPSMCGCTADGIALRGQGLRLRGRTLCADAGAAGRAGTEGLWRHGHSCWTESDLRDCQQLAALRA